MDSAIQANAEMLCISAAGEHPRRAVPVEGDWETWLMVVSAL